MLSIIAFFVNADSTIDQQEQINQALINARSKVDFNKVKEQQEQQNKDNQLAIKISEITGIPSWRNIVFIRQSRNGNKIDFNLLINLLNHYLIQNQHNELTNKQISEIYNIFS